MQRTLRAYVETTMVGAAAWALVEGVGGLLITLRDVDLVPAPLLLASWGKIALTHLLFWLGIFLSVVVLATFVPRIRAAPRFAFWAVWIVVSMVVILPADVALAGHFRRWLPPALLIASIPILFVLRRLIRRWESRQKSVWCHRAGSMILLLGVAHISVTGSYFALYSLRGARIGKPAHSEHLRLSKVDGVLWIVLDACRADHLSIYGYPKPTTPFLENFAASAVLFERAISNSMWTVPGHASMFTGLSMREHGMGDPEPRRLKAKQPFVAEILREKGYQTASFSNNPWISRYTDLTRGFTDCFSMHHLRHLGRNSIEFLYEWSGLTPISSLFDGDHGAAMTNGVAMDWIDDRLSANQKWFAFINFMESHGPYKTPKEYRRLFLDSDQVRRSYELRYRAHGCIVQATNERFNIEGPEFLSLSDRAVLTGQYDAGIRYLDDRISELISGLKQRGVLDSTLVIITADHGEHLDTHEMWSHCFLTYNDLIHVPMLIKPRDANHPLIGARIRTPVLLSDLFVTVLADAAPDALNEVNPGNRNLLDPAIASDEERTVISEYRGANPLWVARMQKTGKPEVLHRIPGQRSISDGHYKYMTSADGLEELYDLYHDPTESHNLIATQPDRAERFAEQLRIWLDSVPEHQALSSDQDMPDSPTMKDALRGLGYVDEE